MVARSTAGASGTGDYFLGGGDAALQELISSEGLREADAAEINDLASPRDEVHMVWLSGPTYRGKLERNNHVKGVKSWPTFSSGGGGDGGGSGDGNGDDGDGDGGSDDGGFGALFLRGAVGHCLAESAGVSLLLEQCRKQSDGVHLRLESSTGKVVTEDGALELCAAGGAQDGAVLELTDQGNCADVSRVREKEMTKPEFICCRYVGH